MNSSIYAAKQEGIKDFNEAMETFGLNFDVDRVPLFTNKGGMHKIRQNEAIIRTDNKECIGVVSPKYPIISPREKFGALEEFSKEGIIEFVDGGTFGKFDSKVYLSARIGDTINVRPDVGDIVEKRIIFVSSYDGTKSNEINSTLYRLVCSNGLTIPETEFSEKFKNTKNSLDRIQAMAVTLESLLNDYRKVEDFFAEALKTEVSATEMQAFAKKVVGYEEDKADDEVSTRKKNMFTDLIKTIEDGIGQAEIEGMTVYKLLNGVTCWTNHNLAGKKDDITDFVYFGTGNRYNQIAYAEAMAMVH